MWGWSAGTGTGGLDGAGPGRPPAPGVEVAVGQVLHQARRPLLRLAAAVLVTGACSAGPVPPDGATGPAPGASGTADPPAAPDAPTAGPADAVAAVSAVPADPAAAGSAAVDLLSAWARPDLGPAEWLAGVAPLLSPTAADAAQGTDPAVLPASAVTGDPTPRPSGSDLLALLDVPVDTGTCSVLLSWDDVAGRWQGERITCAGDPP